VRAGSPAATLRRVGMDQPPLAKTRGDLPPELSAAIDRTLRPQPDERGDLADLADALAEALPEVSDDGGTVAPHPLEDAYAMPSWSARAAAALATGALVLCALAGLLPDSSLPALGAAAGAALLVALLPGGGWLVAAAGTLGVMAFGTDPRVGAALLVFLAVSLPPLALRTVPLAWSAPAAAPVLGLVGLAGAFPALAGTARSAWTRAALGVTGLWWLLLAEALLGRTLLFGAPADVPPRPQWDGAASITASEVVQPLVTSGALLLAVLWGVAALVMPWIVRGRSLSADIIGATVWAAGVAGATVSIGEAVSASAPKGLVAGALAAGILAVGWRWVHPGTTEELDLSYS